MNHFPRLFLSAASVALLAGGTHAHAQTPPPPPETNASVGLEEVVVTAEKRQENAQKAPLAVTSLSADALESAHVVGATDLARVVPDVQVDLGGSAGDPGGASAVFSIRGLGASAAGVQGSAGVAVHFDGVYRQDGVSNSEFFDLERVEVDPGPQGTLYGRSAAAGAVNVIPNKPTNQFEGYATIELGNYASVRSEAMLNVPVDDQLAIRASFQSQDHDGYFTNGYDDLDAQAGRLQVLYKPNDDLSVRLYGDYTHIGGTGTSDIFVGGPAFPGLAALLPQVNANDPRDRSIASYCVINGQLVDACVQKNDVVKWSAHLDASYDFGWGQLTVLPAYHEQDQTQQNANAPLPLSNYDQVPYDDRQMNFEARLNDPGNTPIKWVGGFNIYHNETETDIQQHLGILTTLPVFGNGPPIPTGFAPGVVELNPENAAHSQQDSYAVFGQMTYPVLDWLRLTAGGRYNYDSSSYTGDLSTLSEYIYYLNGPLFAPVVTKPISTGPLSTAARFRAFTYRFAADADLTPDSLIYGSIGSGYKPGGLNDGGTASTNTPGQLAALGPQITPPLTAAQLVQFEPSQSFGPEKVTHYEIGTKNRFWDNRLELNDAIYYDDYGNYQNAQTEVVNPLIYRVQGFIVSNAGESEVYGNELSAKYRLSPSDLLDVSVNYLHATFTKYVAPGFLTPSGYALPTSFTGARLANAPAWSGNVGYQHFFDLSNGSELTASVFTHLSGSYFVYFAETQGTHQGSYTDTTLDLAWASPNQKWTVRGFVNNLEDRTIASFGLDSAGYSQIHLDPPRTFGFSVTAKF